MVPPSKSYEYDSVILLSFSTRRRTQVNDQRAFSALEYSLTLSMVLVASLAAKQLLLLPGNTC